MPSKEVHRQLLKNQSEPTPTKDRIVYNEYNTYAAAPCNEEEQEHIAVLYEYTNTKSLMSIRDELFVRIATEKPGVITITEIWVNNNHLISEFSFKGYESSLKNKEHEKGSGVI